MASLEEYRNERITKLEALKELGFNPYPAHTNRSTVIKPILDDFEAYEGKEVSVAGRISSIREHGQLTFIDIKDQSGQLQLLIKADELSASNPSEGHIGFAEIRLLDTGDFLEATGTVAKTQRGEISVAPKYIRLLTKSIRPLPDSHTGLTDKETRLRRRYLDTAVNDEVRERFIRRSNFWKATRDFLNDEGFLEINTSVLEHTTGGADATPFVTHMNALGEDFYLRISHELPLKRLLGGGYDRVFDIGPRFRNENYSDEHLPEHIAFESYAAYQDFRGGMELYERMMKHVAKETWGTLQFKVNGFEVNLDQEWPVVKYADIMKERFGVDVFNPDLEQLKQILAENKVKLDGDVNVNRAMDSVWKIIRRESAGPYWLIHEPVAISPLAKQDPEDAKVTQRFHPVIAGSELGNGYSELNDPQDQLQRFIEQQKLRDGGDDEAQMLDIDFVEMLEYGMPPACGWSYSERYFWMFEGVSAREGVPFPQLRREVSQVTQKIYPEVYGPEGLLAKEREGRVQDFSQRFVLVVNKTLEPWQMANTVAHMSAYLGNQLVKEQFDSGDFFITQDGEAIPRNSQHPIIIKRADEKELHKLREAAKETHVKNHVFIQEMQDTNRDQEIVDTLSGKELADVVFYGVGVFGDNEQIDSLTKKFQLWK